MSSLVREKQNILGWIPSSISSREDEHCELLYWKANILNPSLQELSVKSGPWKKKFCNSLMVVGHVTKITPVFEIWMNPHMENWNNYYFIFFSHCQKYYTTSRLKDHIFVRKVITYAKIVECLHIMVLNYLFC